MTEKTYFITKYALTAGVQRLPCRVSADEPEYVWDNRPYYFTSYKLGRDAFETEADAIANAEARRTKKIAQLLKQIAALEKLIFSVKGE